MGLFMCIIIMYMLYLWYTLYMAMVPIVVKAAPPRKPAATPRPRALPEYPLLYLPAPIFSHKHEIKQMVGSLTHWLKLESNRLCMYVQIWRNTYVICASLVYMYVIVEHCFMLITTSSKVCAPLCSISWSSVTILLSPKWVNPTNSWSWGVPSRVLFCSIRVSLEWIPWVDKSSTTYGVGPCSTTNRIGSCSRWSPLLFRISWWWLTDGATPRGRRTSAEPSSSWWGWWWSPAEPTPTTSC